MKGLAAILLGAIMLLSVVPSYDTLAAKPENPGKPEFVSIEKLLEPKKIQLPDGRVLEKRVHIFPNENAAKPDGKGGGPPDGKGGGNGGGDKGSTCYAAISKGAIWKTTPEPYVVDDSSLVLAPGVALSGIKSSISVWEDEITSETDVFGSGSEGAIDVIAIQNADRPSGVNEIAFADLGSGGTIAVTISWGVWGGPPSQREIVEWDQIYNTNVFKVDESGNRIPVSWGDAGSTDEDNLVNINFMDFDNIAVHEVGHAAGLDHSGSDCDEESMYAYAQAGETKKRTLNAGDIAGINRLY